MGCTSDEPYLSLDTAYTRIYARIMKKELKDVNTKDNAHVIFGHTTMEKDDVQEFNRLFKIKYDFKYDDFDKMLGNVDWDTYIDNIYEKRKEYLRDVGLVKEIMENVGRLNINLEHKQKIIESPIDFPISPINNEEKQTAVIKLLIEIYNLTSNRIIRAYKRKFMDKLIELKNKTNKMETNEIIILSSDEEEDIKDIPNKKLTNTENWIFQYQDTRMFGIDTEESAIEEENKIEKYISWIQSELNITDNQDYKLSLTLQLAYITFNPNNLMKSISFGIGIYKILHNTKFENYLDDIITFYTNFSLEQILLLKDYEIFKNDKLNEWLTKEIDKKIINPEIIRISISMDTHKKKDTKEANSEESSEKITEAKEDK